MSDDSLWTKLAKQGYLGTRAKNTATIDGGMNIWDRPAKKDYLNQGTSPQPQQPTGNYKPRPSSEEEF